jgi:hypothetical protein
VIAQGFAETEAARLYRMVGSVEDVLPALGLAPPAAASDAVPRRAAQAG